ncbi:MAG: hypothetical protein QOG58_4335 [Caballeronia sp.]|nr:hypothetical protein [Caballeronia sp.]
MRKVGGLASGDFVEAYKCVVVVVVAGAIVCKGLERRHAIAMHINAVGLAGFDHENKLALASAPPTVSQNGELRLL